MAYGDTFHPAGTARDVKVRSPVFVGVMSLVTLGIYGIYWFYATAKDLSEYGKAKGHDLGQNPTMTVLALVFGWILLLIPTIIALVRFTKRTQAAQRLAGRDPLNGWLAVVLLLVFSPLYDAYVQSELNKAWAAEGGPVPIDEPYVGEPLASGNQTAIQSQSPDAVGSAPERPTA